MLTYRLLVIKERVSITFLGKLLTTKGGAGRYLGAVVS